MKNQNILQQKYVQGKKYCPMFSIPQIKSFLLIYVMLLKALTYCCVTAKKKMFVNDRPTMKTY